MSKAPFEVHEVGWGQFTLGIKLFFKDKSLKPIEILKDLILFDDLPLSTKRPIVNEDYNELIFVQPSKVTLQGFGLIKPDNIGQIVERNKAIAE